MSDPIFRPPLNSIPSDDTPEFVWVEVASPKEESDRKVRWWIIRSGIALAAVCFVVFLGCRPAYRQIKGWRAAKLAGESAAKLKFGRVKEAFTSARAAYLLDGNRVVTVRALASALDAANENAAAIPLWKKALAMDTAELYDFRAAAESALKAGLFSDAGVFIEELVARDPESASTALLSSRLSLAYGKRELALQEAQRALTRDPSNPEAKLLVAGLLLGIPESSRGSEQILFELGAGTSALALKALTLLADSSGLQKEAALSVAELLNAHPLANDAHVLKALRLRCRWEPEHRARYLDEATERFAVENSASLSPFLRLLLELDQPERVLGLLPEKTAQYLDCEKAIIRLDAMALQKRWPDILKYLRENETQLDPALSYLFRARCLTELGNVGQAKPLWNLAIHSARPNPRLLAYIEPYVEKFAVGHDHERTK